MSRNRSGSMSHQDIQGTLFWGFIGFGVLMGLVFPFFSELFLTAKPGMFTWYVLACLVAGVVVGITNYYLVQTLLVGRLTGLRDVLRAYSAGNLKEGCRLDSGGVLGEVIDGVNDLGKNLGEMVGQMATSAVNVANNSEALARSAKESIRGLQTQRKETEKVVSTANDLAATMESMAQRAQQAAEVAREASKSANEGQSVIKQSIDLIGVLSREMDSAAGVVQKLEVDGDRIGGVLEVIQSVAEQTNLLALNAAIEAARAGEQGRGFAVVADEIRTLAQRTQESTHEIRKMIEHLQSVTDEAVQVMQANRERAAAGESHASQAVNSLSKITESVNSITDLNNEIADTVSSQVTACQQVNDVAAVIAGFTADSLSKAEQSNGTSQELSKLAADLQTVIKKFRF